MKVRAFIGRENDNPLGPYVEVVDDDGFNSTDWMKPRTARSLAKRLLVAAEAAEAKFATHKAKVGAK